ncbi:MAG: hypothetical protein AAGC68_10865, partial [Verrucomicrobiota bacterium]
NIAEHAVVPDHNDPMRHARTTHATSMALLVPGNGTQKAQKLVSQIERHFDSEKDQLRALS